jgi:hypothetical protein
MGRPDLLGALWLTHKAVAEFRHRVLAGAQLPAPAAD